MFPRPDNGGNGGGSYTPRSGLPSHDAISYLKIALEVLLLLLAVPWLIRELVRNPARVSRQAASKHLKG